MTAPHILPDSRLKDQNKGSFMADWTLVGGRTVRIEVVPIHCGNCGKLWGHVPRDNTAFVFWLCGKCFEKHGTIAGTMVEGDDAFRRKLEAEMLEKYGRALTDLELFREMEHGDGKSPLELLEKESPYKVWRGES